jgi:hypothetical protein
VSALTNMYDNTLSPMSARVPPPPPFHAFPRRVHDLSCSFCQKETQVSLGLQDSVVLQDDNLLSPQPGHASIHGGG